MALRHIYQDFLKFCLYWIFLVASCLIAFVLAATHMTVKPLQFQAPTSSVDDVYLPNVSLTAEAISVDPISRTIIMNWYPALTVLNCPSNETRVIDVYMQNTLLDTTSPSWGAQLVDQPAFRLNSTMLCLEHQTLASFRTVTKLIASKQYVNVQKIAHQSSFQDYPFDVYLAPFSLYIQNNETGEIATPKVSGAFGIAVNFKISLLNSYLEIQGLPYLHIFLQIERSTATKIFVLAVAITNWLTAIAFLTICAANIVYKSPEIYSEIFVVPVGTLFAFSSIRANFPGAPSGFGATIDMFTIVPVLIIMSSCSFSLLLVILYRRVVNQLTIQDKKREYRDGSNTPTNDKTVIPGLRNQAILPPPDACHEALCVRTQGSSSNSSETEGAGVSESENEKMIP